jgi:acetyltransferase-like isoleucine patch superfamily enzyme
VSLFDQFILKVKRGNTPFYRGARAVGRRLVHPAAPRIPGFLRAPLKIVYEIHFGVLVFGRMLVNLSYRNPVFQARCSRAGKNLSIDTLPFVSGHADIEIGDDVWLGGRISITSGRFEDCPRLVIKDRCGIGWNVQITVNREVIIEEDVLVSFDCRISDSDGHPREADLRAQKAALKSRDIRPVRICRNAWIGNGAHIMKGVTIGEGAVIGANSVVISDVPAYSLALGNPAEVFIRNYGRPSGRRVDASES